MVQQSLNTEQAHPGLSGHSRSDAVVNAVAVTSQNNTNAIVEELVDVDGRVDELAIKKTERRIK